MVEVDSPNGSQGPEHIYLIPEISGLYQLEVSCWNKNAPAGRYEVKVMEIRLATHEDTFRITAQKAYGEGNRLEAQKAADSLKRAISKYEEALNNWVASNDLVGQALTLNKLGGLYYSAGEPKKALEFQSRALPLIRAVNEDPSLEGRILNSIGAIHNHLGENREALDCFLQSLSIRRAVG